MTFDLEKIFAGKEDHRRLLAGMSIGEKLRMLDVLREREVEIRGQGQLGAPSPNPPKLSRKS